MDIPIVVSALGLGFATGFHCIGMCGPIALSMGLTRHQQINFYLQNITYQLGRIVTYSLLGAILGIVGEGFEMAGFQRILTIIAGILLIIMTLFSFSKKNLASKIPFINKFLLKLKINLGKILHKSDYHSRFTVGLLNGFLPCGMVYMALTASMTSGGVWQGALFMSFFGIGTFPFMFAVVLFGNLISNSLRMKALKVIPIFMIILGGLFILRGMEIGIPYLSPNSEHMKVSKEHGHNHMHDNKENETFHKNHCH